MSYYGIYVNGYAKLYSHGIVSREWCEYHSYLNHLIWRSLGHPGYNQDALMQERDRVEGVLA